MVKWKNKTWWWLFLVGGVLLFQAAAWFDFAVLDYAADSGWFPFRTSGWFILGQVVVLPAAVVYAAFFLLIARWLARPLAFCLMLIVSAVLIALAVRSAQPRRQLLNVIGEKALAQATIERLNTTDSFNGGMLYWGRLRGSPDLIQHITFHRPLTRYADNHSLVEDLRYRYPDDPISSAGDMYADRNVAFLCAGGNRLYFFYRSQPRE
jgi:hypothetical protein